MRYVLVFPFDTVIGSDLGRHLSVRYWYVELGNFISQATHLFYARTGSATLCFAVHSWIPLEQSKLALVSVTRLKHFLRSRYLCPTPRQPSAGASVLRLS